MMEPAGQKNRTMPYELTEEERRVLRECSHESFLYRSLPFSVFSILVTQVLIKKGILSTHSKWGSLPKVTFAGVCGYFLGKISYMDKCKEKLLKLENSQLGNLLRKPNLYGRDSQQPSFSNVPSPTESDQVGQLPQTSKYPVDNYGAIDFPSDQSIPFSSSVGESSPSGITDNPPPEYVPPPEEITRRRITYDELRSKNREMYEAGMQKSDNISKPTQERPFKKEVKVNKYGDTWEE